MFYAICINFAVSISVSMIIIENVIKAVCAHFKVDYSRFNSLSEKPSIARYTIWLYLHCEMGMSVGKLTKYFNRNKASIFRGIRIMKHHVKYDKAARDEYIAVKKKIEGMTKSHTL